MDSATIRDSFFAFFTERGHERVASSSLIPNDPSLLLTNAGMNQFKPYFIGEQTPPFDRAVSVQKCMRAGGKHNDIEVVGKTARHLTFFEMLGNFSFGDYYKEKACPWAWELVTEVYGLEPSRLWVTIYDTDDEAFEVWRDGVGVPAERIIRMGKADNFWSMGVAGPCGPCSEIAVDMGDAFGPPSDDGPQGNEDRYLEIWNLVFMQNDCNAQIEPVAELPKKNIDTGAGLERIAMVLQEKASVFDTDILRGMIETAERLTGARYGDDERADIGLRILADHGRSISFMLADGVLPSNEERGYVLRFIMRRAMRNARLLGRDEPMLDGLIDATVELMGDAYPELRQKRDLAAEIAAREEEGFDETLRQASPLAEREIASAREAGTRLAGDVAFKLHDTHGLPIDLTVEMAREAGLEVDIEAYEELMTQQRERARAARRAARIGQATERDVARGITPFVSQEAAQAIGSLLEEHGETEFVGYEHLTSPAKVIGIARGGASSPAASEGDEVEIITDRTVFYPEGGGQVGDRGAIRAPSGEGRVVDTQRLAPGLVAHRVRILAGEIAVGEEVTLAVDPRWRIGAERAHTATHILHWVLRDRLGDHAHQAGSLVEPGRLRFDFNHFDALGQERVGEISAEIQERVLADDPVHAFETSYEYARSMGAMAIFGEKYGDFVRVVEVGDYSKELCGGTHVPHTSQIGVVVATGEGSIGANLRRIEALVGKEGLEHLKRRAAILDRAAATLKVAPDEVADRIERLLTTQKEMERRIAQIDKKAAEGDAATLADQSVELNGTRLVVARRDVAVDALRSLAQSIKGRLGSAIVVLGTGGEGRANLVGAVSKDLAQRGISARELLAPGAELLGGGAGGKPELAISGGPSTDRLDDAIEAVARAARAALGG